MSVCIGLAVLTISVDGIYVANSLCFCLLTLTDFISVRAIGIVETVRSMGLAYSLASGWAWYLYLSSLAFLSSLVAFQVPSNGQAGLGIAVLSSLVSFQTELSRLFHFYVLS